MLSAYPQLRIADHWISVLCILLTPEGRYIRFCVRYQIKGLITLIVNKNSRSVFHYQLENRKQHFKTRCFFKQFSETMKTFSILQEQFATWIKLFKEALHSVGMDRKGRCDSASQPGKWLLSISKGENYMYILKWLNTKPSMDHLFIQLSVTCYKVCVGGGVVWEPVCTLSIRILPSLSESRQTSSHGSKKNSLMIPSNATDPPLLFFSSSFWTCQQVLKLKVIEA